MAGVFQVVYVYTPEVYPTNLRAVAYGKYNNCYLNDSKKMCPNIISESYLHPIYITKLSFTLGSASSVARIGAMITPYIAQVLVDHNLFSAIGVYAVMGKLVTS